MSTFYMSPNGSNSNDGLTALTPKLNPAGIQAITSHLVGDDVVNIMQGDGLTTYTTTWTLSEGGTSGHYVTWQAYAGHTPVMSGGAAINISGPYIKLVGMRVNGASARAINVDGGLSDNGHQWVKDCVVNVTAAGINGIHCEQCPGALIEGCTVNLAGGDGIQCNINNSFPDQHGTGIEIKNCTVTNSGQNAIYTETDACIIHGCTLDVNGLGTNPNPVHGVYSKSIALVCYNNTITNMQANGISLRASATVYNNRVSYSGNNNISGYCDSDTLDPNATLNILNNIIFNELSGNGGFNFSGSNSTTGWTVNLTHNTAYEARTCCAIRNFTGTIKIANNIFDLLVNTAGRYIIERQVLEAGGYATPASYIERYNQHILPSGMTLAYAWSGTAISAAAYATASGSGTNVVGGVAGFADAANFDFHITSASAGRVAANLTDLAVLDFAGATRTNPGSLGAYELDLGGGVSEVVTTTEAKQGNLIRKKSVWVSDGSGNATGVIFGEKVNARLVGAQTVPAGGGSAPTDNYDITLPDAGGFDVALGALMNRDTANTENVALASLSYLIHSDATLTIANAGDTKGGTLYTVWETM